MSLRKKSAIVLFGVMALGLSAHMMTSAVSEIGDAGNKTVQINSDSDTKSDSSLFLDLKNKNEDSFLYTDSTNKKANSRALGENKTDGDLLYVDNMPESKVKSELSKNAKIALGAAGSFAGASAIASVGYAVKNFVVDKKASKEGSQNQGNQEQQGNDKKEENEENNSQGSGTNGNNGKDETGSQSQTSENHGSNSGNGVNLKVIVPIVAGVALLIVVATVVTLVVRKLKSSKISANVNNFENSAINNSDSNNDEGNINDNEVGSNDEGVDELRSRNISYIMANMGFDENLAGEFYDLISEGQFQQAVNKAIVFFQDKFNQAVNGNNIGGLDPNFTYNAIVRKIGSCIDYVVTGYNYGKSDENEKINDDSEIFKNLREIAINCNKAATSEMYNKNNNNNNY